MYGGRVQLPLSPSLGPPPVLQSGPPRPRFRPEPAAIRRQRTAPVGREPPPPGRAQARQGLSVSVAGRDRKRLRRRRVVDLDFVAAPQHAPAQVREIRHLELVMLVV